MKKFVDAQKMQEKYPKTFEAPTWDELSKLEVGDLVKVCYNDEERFWVIITEINHKNNKIKGRVDNALMGNFGFSYGDEIEFEKRHVYVIWGD